MPEDLAPPDSVKLVNDALLRLWTEQPTPPALVPLFYGELKAEGFVSVGLNPAFSAHQSPGWNHIEDEKLGLKHVWKNPRSFFAWSDPVDLSKKQDMVRCEQLAHEKHPFYQPIRDLHKELPPSLPWQHLDIFFQRCTQQKSLAASYQNDAARDEKGPLFLNDFARAQFDLFERLLKLSRPKIVVVVNAWASRIYKAKRKPPYDALVGCHIDKIGGRDVPVLFSGHLKYQDPFTKERLKWHVRHVHHHFSSLQPAGAPKAGQGSS